MDSHDPERIATGQSRQYWRAFWPIMHLHENHSIKRAGVAGIRARAGINDQVASQHKLSMIFSDESYLGYLCFKTVLKDAA
ncbi:hypothetical protein D4N15_10695 [Klebsiella pneumoniae]|nr:hypothetical protein D4N15_10695 [Klebsiella pneumoniae]